MLLTIYHAKSYRYARALTSLPHSTQARSGVVASGSYYKSGPKRGQSADGPKFPITVSIVHPLEINELKTRPP